MQIYIMRHGEAQTFAPSDAERVLTSRGVQMSAEVGKWLSTKQSVIERVLVSPYTRAQQTLTALKTVISLPYEIEILPSLTPNGDEQEIAAYLQLIAERENVQSVLIVSHLPLVGYLVSELCPQDQPPGFSTSTMACVNYNVEQGSGLLEWVYRGREDTRRHF